MPQLPSQESWQQKVDTHFFNVPVPQRPHGFELRVQMPDRHARRGSFSMSISAHQQQQNLGSISMRIHRNQAPVDHQSMDPSQIGRRVQGRTTAYIGSLRNETFTGFNRGVPGVGSTLMNQAERFAQHFGAHKMSLHPASTTFERYVPRLGFPPWEKQTRKYDPTGFYQHIGYQRDPVQKRFHKQTIQSVLPPDQADQWAESRTALLSKPLKRQRAMSMPNLPRRGHQDG